VKVRNALYISGLSAISFSHAAPSANAQEIGREVCREMGRTEPDPLGDRQGHAISHTESSCKTKEGLTAGAVSTVSTLLEWDGATATLVSPYDVGRGPGGGVMAFQGVDAKIDLTMTAGGKPIGWTGSGHSIVTLSSGPLEALKGKTISWTARSRQYNQVNGLQPFRRMKLPARSQGASTILVGASADCSLYGAMRFPSDKRSGAEITANRLTGHSMACEPRGEAP
jgi:hypothetical protein